MFFFDSGKKIHDFLVQLGADSISHVKGKTFHEHVTRVGELLEWWGFDEPVVNAGLCHSLYSTEMFDKVLLTLDRREELATLIGKEAEEIVFHFCSMKRNTFQVAGDTFTYVTRANATVVTLGKEQGTALLHILFANDIDHIHEFNVFAMSSMLTHRYAQCVDSLVSAAHSYYEEIQVSGNLIPNRKPYVRFTGHAGVHVHTKEHSIAIDPWFYSSTREQPRIQGFDPQSSSIDFMIPEPRNTLEEVNPDIILLSHFHTHHAPYEEIKESAQRKAITIICPPLPDTRLNEVRRNMGDEIFGNIQFIFVREDITHTIGNTKIRAFTHIKRGHIAFFVEIEEGSVFHLSDPHASSSDSLKFDTVWDKFNELGPDFAFISCAGHAQRRILKNGEREIAENQTFSPTQAAKFAIKMKAKSAGAVGIYNYSLWTDRIEFSRTSSESEREFHWALSFLSPSTRVLTLRPGDLHYF